MWLDMVGCVHCGKQLPSPMGLAVYVWRWGGGCVVVVLLEYSYKEGKGNWYNNVVQGSEDSLQQTRVLNSKQGSQCSMATVYLTISQIEGQTRVH